MGKLLKTAEKLSPSRYVLGKKTFRDITPLATQAITASDAADASKKALKDAADEPVVPLPDEEELDRVRRRRTARRGGGRAATVLSSDDNRLGG